MKTEKNFMQGTGSRLPQIISGHAVAFWNDADHTKYRSRLFQRWPNIWQHGDWCERTAHGGFIIHGRSDSTTNRQGIRIGTGGIL